MPIELGQYTIAILDNTENTSNIIEKVKYTGQRDGDTVVNVPVVTGGVEPQPYYETQLPLTQYTVLDADADHLVAWYKFDGDFTDSSGNGHNLIEYITESTPTTSTYSIIGESVQFINNDDYLEFPTSINPYTIWNGNGITFSFWVRFTEHENWSRLIDFQSSTTSNDSGFFIAIKGNPSSVNRALWIKIGSTTFGYSNWSDPLITSLGVWNHILFSIDTSNNWNVYLNNVRINGTEQGAIPNYTWVHRFINKSTYGGDGKFDGQMDDFRIYDKALTPTEIGYLANKMIVNPEYKTLTFTYDDTRYPTIDADDSNLVAHYKFDDDTNKGLNSATSTNSIGDASLNGTPTLNSSEYVIGKSSYFSGSGDHSFVLDDNSDNLYNAIYQKPITITFWCKSLGAGQTNQGRVFYGGPTGSSNNYNAIQCMHRDGSNQLTFIVTNNGDSNAGNYMPTTQLPAFNTAWSHIAFVIEPQSTNWTTKEHIAKIYVNGVLDQTYTNIWYPLITQNYDFEIGRWTTNEDSREYNGYLDDFRIYDKVLTQEEINTLYNNPQTPYTLTFDNPTECDILIVAGGGGGGSADGGGGGAGGLIYSTGIELNGTYTIKVGNGGVGGVYPDGNPGQKGSNSEITGGEINQIAIGGGGGGQGYPTDIEPSPAGGGSSGGLGSSDTSRDALNVHIPGQGNSGGLGDATRGGGGGGGAGASGNDGGSGTSNGLGGDGLQIDITGVNIFYAGGGGGGHAPSDADKLGGQGGGGLGKGRGDGNDGELNTGGGGGGGGGGAGGGNGGHGGSGIVIIRYKQQYNQVPYNAQWTYSSTDPTVHHYGNVGIGTTAHPSTALTIKGDVNVIGNYFNDEKMLFSNPWYEMDNKDIYKIVGNVGIGTHEPQYKLHIQRELYANNGGFSGNGSTSWSTTSDRRIKENVVEASYDLCFENIKNINLYKFNYAEKFSKTTKRTQFGFVAQEVQNYYPKAVQERKIQVKDNLTIKNLLTVDVTQLNYTLYGAVKHFVNEVDKIKSQLGIIDVVEEEPVPETTEEEPVPETTEEEPVINVDIV